VKFSKISCAKTFHFHKANGQCIAHNYLGSSTAGGSQVIWTGLLRHSGVQYHISAFCQVALHITAHGNNFIFKVFNEGYQNLYFRAVPAFADDHNYIRLLNHTNIAVDGIRGMQKDGRRSCAIERRYNFLCNDRTFTYAAYNKPAFTMVNGRDSFFKFFIYQIREFTDRAGFKRNCFFCRGNNIFHSGDSAVIDFKGESMNDQELKGEYIKTYILKKEPLEKFREQFAFFEDRDLFNII